MVLFRDTLIIVEVILGRKHRQWSVAKKRRIVAEANQPGTNKAAVARRHGISDSQLYAWRKVFGDKANGHFLAVVTDDALVGKNDGSSGSIDIVLSNGHRLAESALGLVSSQVSPVQTALGLFVLPNRGFPRILRLRLGFLLS